MRRFVALPKWSLRVRFVRTVGLLALGALGGVLGSLALNAAQNVSVISPDAAAARSAPPAPSVVTATVEVRELSQTLRLRAHVRLGTGTPLLAPAGSRDVPMVTDVLARVSEPLEYGDVIAEVAGRPIIVLRGDFDLYRDLVGGSEGADVEQLQQALINLGYQIDLYGVLGPETQRAIEQLFNDRGFEPLPGVPSADLVVQAANDAVADARHQSDEARRVLTAAELALDDALASPDLADDGPAQEALAAARYVAELAARALQRAYQQRWTTVLEAGPTVLRSELLFRNDLPALVSTLNIEVGSVLSDDGLLGVLGLVHVLVTGGLG